MKIENMAAVNEQYEKNEKFVGTLFLFWKKRKPVLKEKRGKKRKWLRKEGERKTEKFRR